MLEDHINLQSLAKIENDLAVPIHELEDYRLEKFQKLNPQKLWISRWIMISFFTITLIYLIDSFFIKSQYLDLLFIAFFIIQTIDLLRNRWKTKALQKEDRKYEKMFTKRILEPMAKIIIPNFRYLAKQEQNPLVLDQEILFKKTKHKYISKNIFEGSINNIPVIFGTKTHKKDYSFTNTIRQFSDSRLVYKISLGTSQSNLSIYSASIEQMINKNEHLNLVNHKDFPSLRIYLKEKTMRDQLPIDFLNYLSSLEKAHNISFVLRLKGSDLFLALVSTSGYLSPQLSMPLVAPKKITSHKNKEILDSHLEIPAMTEYSVSNHLETLNLCLDINKELEKLIPKLRK